MRSWSPIFLEDERNKYSLDVLGCLKYAVRMKESFSFIHGNALNSTFDLGIWKTTVEKAKLTFKGLLMKERTMCTLDSTHNETLS